MSDIIKLADHRPPVVYTISVEHHWDGRVVAYAMDVSDDARSKEIVWDTLMQLLTDGQESGPHERAKIVAFHHIDRGWGASWHVECAAEECGNSTCHHDTEANAIAAWNTRQPTQSDVLKAAGDAIRGLLDITSDYNLDSEQAGRAYAALHDIDTALKGQSK